MASEGRAWRGASPDERQLERRQRLFDATLELSVTDGIGSLTVRAICAQAGLTSRYFYESFTDTAHLLLSLYDDLATNAIAKVAAGVVETTDGGLRESVRSGVNAGVAFLFDDPKPIRFLLVSATARPDLNSRRRQLIADVTDLGTAAVLHGTGIVDVPARVAVTARFVIGGLLEVATTYVEGDAGYDLEELVESAVDIVLGLVEETLASLDPNVPSDV